MNINTQIPSLLRQLKQPTRRILIFALKRFCILCILSVTTNNANNSHENSPSKPKIITNNGFTCGNKAAQHLLGPT